ncbi:hypothetical protein B484DRAFT_408655 [Ochromonadaceae sp. CCMP2298]|nr:hypothetical protein B484DRAFT_408655 [Ochromonadaceae sp. CCMP2298]
MCADAFRFDELSAELVQLAVDRGFMESYAPIQRFFLGVAAQHSEQLSMQALGVRIAAGHW